jgi:hypothetical protein
VGEELKLPDAFGVGFSGEGGAKAEEGGIDEDGDEGREEDHQEKGSGESQAERPQNGEEDVGAVVRIPGGDEHALHSWNDAATVISAAGKTDLSLCKKSLWHM